ncbi:hypothetical protein RDABS01_020093 [Bienertia sinuspersici]
MAENFTPASLPRRGAKIPVDIYEAPKGNLQSLVVGKFIDNKRYPLWQIQQWVVSWETRGRVEVSQDHDVYYLFFHNPRDWDIFVGQHNTLNFKGSLLLLRPWSYTMSYKSINFSATGLWVKAEGIPFILTSEEFASKIFGTAGGVLDIDGNPNSQEPQRFLRARVWTQLGKPLVPGCYIEYEPDKLLWVDFKYEGVFHFCKKCGVIGHTTAECRKSWDEAEQDLNDRIVAYSPPYEVVFGQANHQLYTNKIRGLPNTPSFRTTKVNLFHPPSPASTWYPFTPHSDGRDGDSDGESNNGGSRDTNTPYNPTPTPSVGENMSTSSDGGDDYGGADQQQHQPQVFGRTHHDHSHPQRIQALRAKLEKGTLPTSPLVLSSLEGPTAFNATSCMLPHVSFIQPTPSSRSKFRDKSSPWPKKHWAKKSRKLLPIKSIRKKKSSKTLSFIKKLGSSKMGKRVMSIHAKFYSPFFIHTKYSPTTSTSLHNSSTLQKKSFFFSVLDQLLQYSKMEKFQNTELFTSPATPRAPLFPSSHIHEVTQDSLNHINANEFFLVPLSPNSVPPPGQIQITI